MRIGDKLSLVTCNREASVLADDHTVDTKTVSELEDLLEGVRADDITNLEAGIIEECSPARERLKAGEPPRVTHWNNVFTFVFL